MEHLLLPLFSYPAVRRWDRGRANARVVSAVRRAGPTYVKVAQFIASRGDIFDSDLAQDLEVLQDQNLDSDFDSVGVIHREVDSSLGLVLEPRPFAGASLSVVHRGTDAAGRVLAVKVKRPGVEEALKRDVSALRAAVHSVSWVRPNLIDTVEILDEAQHYLLEEVDFAREASNAERYAECAPSFVRVPTVHAQTENVLVTEYIDGIRLDRLPPDAGIDRKLLARHLLYMQFDAILGGFWHGDTHPGNLLLDARGRVALLDFGLCVDVGGEAVRERLVSLLSAVVDRDVDAFYERLIEQKVIIVNRGASAADVRRYLQLFFTFLERPVERMDVDELQALEKGRGFRFAYEWVVAFKTIASLEGLAKGMAGVTIRDVVEDYGRTRLNQFGVNLERRESLLGAARNMIAVPGKLRGLQTNLDEIAQSVRRTERTSKETREFAVIAMALSLLIHLF